MKFGLTNEECRARVLQRAATALERYRRWHRWFAWRPVRLEDGRIAFLETVERRGVFYYTSYPLCLVKEDDEVIVPHVRLAEFMYRALGKGA